jgi:hypothetical protein
MTKQEIHIDDLVNMLPLNAKQKKEFKKIHLENARKHRTQSVNPPPTLPEEKDDKTQ